MILIDGRVFATSAAHRGMGNYLTQIVDMLLTDTEFDVVLLLPKDTKRNFMDVERLSIHRFDFSADPDGRQIQALIDQFKPSIYLDSTPFIPPYRFDFLGTKTISICYDMIPLLYPNFYLSNESVLQEYKNGIHRILSADGVIFISGSAKHDFELFFGRVQAEIIIQPFGELNFNLTKNKKGSGRILTSIGMHPSKNPLQLAHCLSTLSAKYPEVEFDVVVSSNEWENEFCKLIANRRINTHSNLKDFDYTKLFLDADIYIHASVEEGFGIPLLNAINANCAIVAADIPINKEICDLDSLYLFDPLRSSALFEASELALLNFTKGHLKIAKANTRHFSNFKEFLSQVFADRTLKVVNWLGPLSPQNCGIADYSSAVVSKIAKDVQINYFSDTFPTEDIYFNTNIRVFPISRMQSRIKASDNKVTDIFQIAAAPWFYEYMLEMLTGGSGKNSILILHDHYIGFGLYNLHGADFKFFLKSYIEPENDSDFLYQVVMAHESGNTESLQTLLQSRPILKWLNALPGKVIAHALPLKSTVDVQHLVMPSQIPNSLRPAKFKESPTILKKIIFGCFGRISRNKYLEEAIQAISILRTKGVDASLIVVGEPVDAIYYLKLQNLVSTINLGDHVVFTGSVSQTLYWRYLNSIDILVSLRDKSRGGLSAVLVNGIYLGKSVICSNIEEHQSMFLPKLNLVENSDLVFEIVRSAILIIDELSQPSENFYSASTFYERITS